MRLTFFGAAGEVTGSCLLVEADSVRFLVDCGMFQGGREAAARNRAAFGRDLGRLDFVLLTHAHVDHCGLLPRFSAPGGPQVYCTKPTADLVPVMLKDSAHVQAVGARSAPYRGRRSITDAPLYSADDVDALALRLNGVPYDVEFRPKPSVSVTFRSAGHIVGAAFAEIRVRDGARERKLVVSGDIGEASPLVVRDRAPLVDADVLVMESTYGDRNHRSLAETEDELVAVMDDILHVRRGNVIVPAFALGRTQEFLVLLYRLTQSGRLRVPLVFVDSPLAAQASAVTFRHLEALDELAHAFHQAERARKLPFTLRFTESVDDSMFLNSIRQRRRDRRGERHVRGRSRAASPAPQPAAPRVRGRHHRLPGGGHAGPPAGGRSPRGAAVQRLRAGQRERAHHRRPVGARRAGRAHRLARGRAPQAEDDLHRARRTGGVARALGADREGTALADHDRRAPVV